MLYSLHDKDKPQAEEEDAEDAFLEAISQELSVKKAIGKPLNRSKLASIANQRFTAHIVKDSF